MPTTALAYANDAKLTPSMRRKRVEYEEQCVESGQNMKNNDQTQTGKGKPITILIERQRKTREMGFFTLCIAGGGFVVIGAWEVIIASYAHLNPSSPPVSPPTKTLDTPSPITTTRGRRGTDAFFLRVSFIASAVLSFSFFLNSLLSLIDALNTHDRVGLSLQFEILATVSLFLLYSVVGMLIDFTGSVPLPSSILSLVGFFAFVLEFLLFYLQRKDPSGVENRYFDLMLVPITVCVFSTILELGSSDSKLPRLARGLGLILQGTWFVQMGFSFYTKLMAHGCALHEKSKGNYTVKCKGHPEYHRSRAIATLQFNCHLAFLVVLFVGFYSIIVQKYGVSRGDYMNYKPITAELRKLDNHTQFTLDSDDDDDDDIKEENMAKHKSAIADSGSMVLVPIN